MRDQDTPALLRNILEAAIGASAVPEPLDDDTPLLGAIPELDSMALVAVLTDIQHRLGIPVDDDEISADVFLTFGSLCRFVDERCPGR